MSIHLPRRSRQFLVKFLFTLLVNLFPSMGGDEVSAPRPEAVQTECECKTENPGSTPVLRIRGTRLVEL